MCWIGKQTSEIFPAKFGNWQPSEARKTDGTGRPSFPFQGVKGFKKHVNFVGGSVLLFWDQGKENSKVVICG